MCGECVRGQLMGRGREEGIGGLWRIGDGLCGWAHPSGEARGVLSGRVGVVGRMVVWAAMDCGHPALVGVALAGRRRCRCAVGMAKGLVGLVVVGRWMG